MNISETKINRQINISIRNYARNETPPSISLSISLYIITKLEITARKLEIQYLQFPLIKIMNEYLKNYSQTFTM